MKPIHVKVSEDVRKMVRFTLLALLSLSTIFFVCILCWGLWAMPFVKAMRNIFEKPYYGWVVITALLLTAIISSAVTIVIYRVWNGSGNDLLMQQIDEQLSSTSNEIHERLQRFVEYQERQHIKIAVYDDFPEGVVWKYIKTLDYVAKNGPDDQCMAVFKSKQDRVKAMLQRGLYSADAVIKLRPIMNWLRTYYADPEIGNGEVVNTNPESGKIRFTHIQNRGDRYELTRPEVEHLLKDGDIIAQFVSRHGEDKGVLTKKTSKDAVPRSNPPITPTVIAPKKEIQNPRPNLDNEILGFVHDDDDDDPLLMERIHKVSIIGKSEDTAHKDKKDE